jgi:hypothetical protein
MTRQPAPTDPSARPWWLWFLPTAAMIALGIVIAAAATPLAPSEPSPTLAAASPAGPSYGIQGQTEPITVDWDQLPVEPDPSPRAIAAYHD